MQRKSEGSIQRKMADLRLVCDQEIRIHQQKADSAMNSFRNFLQSIKIRAEESIGDQEKLVKAKNHLRELEDDLVKALAVKTRKEAKRIAIAESLSITKARIEELKKTLKDQHTRRDEYKAIISQPLVALAALEEKSNTNINHLKDLEEAISWYNEALGFRIEGGHGVKFIFNKIDILNPSKEYSFTIRHENDTYTLLDCDPYLEDSKELMRELNKTNGLFRFVRIMREKFCVAASGSLQPNSPPDTSTLTLSAPASSITVSSINESLIEQNESIVESQAEINRPPKKVNRGKAQKQENLSPKSALSLRRSPRFKEDFCGSRMRCSVWHKFKAPPFGAEQSSRKTPICLLISPSSQ
ncbi:hypothetical protein AAC387_Pa10g1669 [Persea americana]